MTRKKRMAKRIVRAKTNRTRSISHQDHPSSKLSSEDVVCSSDLLLLLLSLPSIRKLRWLHQKVLVMLTWRSPPFEL